MVSLHIRRRRIVDIQMHWHNRFGSKRDPVIVHGVDIVKCVQGRFHVSCRSFIAVGRLQ